MESKEVISVYLEIVSFFLVSLDLYGKERLSKTSNGLLGLVEGIKNYLVSPESFTWAEKKNRLVVHGLIIGSSLLGIWLFTYFGGWDRDLNVFVIIGYFLLTVLVFISFILLLSMLVVGIILLVLWLIRLLFIFIFWILSRVRFEGLLLLIGSVLFLVSKLILL